MPFMLNPATAEVRFIGDARRYQYQRYGWVVTTRNAYIAYIKGRMIYAKAPAPSTIPTATDPQALRLQGRD